MTFWYVCYTCKLIGSYQDIAGQDYDLPDDVVHHKHPMVFSIRSYKEAEHYLSSCINNKPKKEVQNAQNLRNEVK